MSEWTLSQHADWLFILLLFAILALPLLPGLLARLWAELLELLVAPFDLILALFYPEAPEAPANPGPGTLNMTATVRRTPSRRPAAEAFLLSRLAHGPVPAAVVLAEAKARGISERTLDRAKARLGIRSRRVRGGWVWTLPAGAADNDPAVGAD